MSRNKKEYKGVSTVGELRKLIANVPDDFELITNVSDSWTGRVLSVYVDQYEKKTHDKNVLTIKTS